MKAPNKIYLEPYLDNPDKLHPSWYCDDIIGSGVEYIRKDALIEWLQLERKKRKGLSLIYWGMRTAFGQVVDKIKSM